MDSSSIPDLVEFIAPPGELVYGSLPRPPESCSISFSPRKIKNLVCLWFLHTLSKHLEFRTPSVDDVVALWSSSKSRFVSREGELGLENLKKIMEYETITEWLDMLLEHIVLIFKRHVNLVSRECSNDGLVLIHHFHKLTSSCLFITPSVGCFELLLLSVAVRLNLLDDSHNFSDCLSFDLLKKSNLRHGFQGFTELIQKLDVSSAKCFLLLTCLCHAKVSSSTAAHVRRLKRNTQLLAVMDKILPWSIMLMSWLKKAKFFFSSWMVYSEIYVSSRCFTRQGESWPELVCFLHKLLSALQQISRQWEWLMRTNHLVTLNHEDDYEFVGQGLMLCSASHITFPFPCYIGFIEEFLRFEEVFYVCVSPGCCYLDHVVRIPQELFLRQFLFHQFPKCFFTHSVIIWNQAFLSLCQTCDCGTGNCWLACYDLLLRQSWWLHLLHFGFLHMKKLISVAFHVLFQGLSREVEFIGQIVQASSDWFGSFLTFFYGSSPKPPDDRCAFGFTLLKFSWGSQTSRVF